MTDLEKTPWFVPNDDLVLETLDISHEDLGLPWPKETVEQCRVDLAECIKQAIVKYTAWVFSNSETDINLFDDDGKAQIKFAHFLADEIGIPRYLLSSHKLATRVLEELMQKVRGVGTISVTQGIGFANYNGDLILSVDSITANMLPRRIKINEPENDDTEMQRLPPNFKSPRGDGHLF